LYGKKGELSRNPVVEKWADGPIRENSLVGERIASQLQELSEGKGGNVRRKFKIFLGKITRFHPKYGFFHMKIRNQPYSFLIPSSGIL